MVAIDSNGNPRVVVEGIAWSEGKEAYIFWVNSILKMSLWHNYDEIFATFTDGMLSPAIVSSRKNIFHMQKLSGIGIIYSMIFGLSKLEWDDKITYQF